MTILESEVWRRKPSVTGAKSSGSSERKTRPRCGCLDALDAGGLSPRYGHRVHMNLSRGSHN